MGRIQGRTTTYTGIDGEDQGGVVPNWNAKHAGRLYQWSNGEDRDGTSLLGRQWELVEWRRENQIKWVRVMHVSSFRERESLVHEGSTAFLGELSAMHIYPSGQSPSYNIYLFLSLYVISRCVELYHIRTI